MPWQIARIPVSNTLRLRLWKSQLLLSVASLNFVIFVGARWFGCYVKNSCDDTTPNNSKVNSSSSGVVQQLFVSKMDWNQLARIRAVWNHERCFCQNPFFLSLVPLSIRPPFLALCLTAARLNQLGSIRKWSKRSVVQGVSLTRLCTLSRITTVCKSFGECRLRRFRWCFVMFSVPLKAPTIQK